ncbi:hypothetical protein DVH05_000136 [Phytophthora capsici]|nr:hypothetical protein DVH05_000136 [Phytophthora capsici]
MGDNEFKLLRRALKQANFVLNAKGMVFAILVDTNSRVHEFVPALSADPSSRVGTGSMSLFPPFVLTETTDILMRLRDE